MNKDKERIQKALALIFKYTGIQGIHHKQWLLDQIVRVLSEDGSKYYDWVREYCKGDEGPNTYEWDEGIAP